jgi:hypothetical protein
MMPSKPAPRDPKTQPQIGEPVTYLPEGVVTTVTGYQWSPATGNPAVVRTIVAYVLACGVTVSAEHIAQIEPEKPAEPAPIEKPPAATSP